MDEMKPFLQAIAQDPEDDAPRLAFSDWLEERGESDRAEFIRLQIELANMDPTDEGYAEKTAKMHRCDVLTKRGKHRFFDYLPTKKLRIGFRRGFIDAINTNFAKKIDTSGFDLVPLQALRAPENLLENFKCFPKLKWLEVFNGYGPSSSPTPTKLLETLGPQGWFKNLVTLSFPSLNTACLEAGVIPQFDLPRLRNFFITTDAFYSLGAPQDIDYDDDAVFSGTRAWDGLPDYLPKNALPNPKCPLERFVWHSDDDCDYFNDEDWYWRGPTMESLVEHLKDRDLKQIEVVTDYDDHEKGAEGVIAAPWEQNPLEVSSTLERVTVDVDNLSLLEGSTQKLKALRIYGYDFPEKDLATLLHQPVCSELESLYVGARGGYWGDEPEPGLSIHLPKLKSLHLAGAPLGYFANCQFPNLISLPGGYSLRTIMERKWPKLQCLSIYVGQEDVADLKAFAQSDCCPNLTTLTFEMGYGMQETTDISFLAKCPHLPHLSLIRIPHYSKEQAYVVRKGKLIPVRSDLMLDDLTPRTSDRIPVAF